MQYLPQLRSKRDKTW